MSCCSRRTFLGTSLALAASAALAPASASDASPAYRSLAPGVGYVPGDVERRLTCNTGVVAGAGGLTIVDATLPDGAAAADAAIRRVTNRPPVRVVNTHFHLDHLYGNGYWSDRGAVPIAYAGVRAELHAAEPELDGRGPGLWQKLTPTLPQLRRSRLVEPTYVASGMTYDGRTIRLLHPGIGHTHSDLVVWLPETRVLFTGDLVANGPYNAVGNSTIHAWLRTLDRLVAFDPDIVVPGHGAAGGPELITAQHRYFETVIDAVDATVRRGGDVARAVPAIREAVLADPDIAHFVNDHHAPYSGYFAFRDLVAKVYHESTGRTIASRPGDPRPAICCGDLRA
jgi:cyclase